MNDAAVPAEFLSAAATGPLVHASTTVSLTCYILLALVRARGGASVAAVAASLHGLFRSLWHPPGQSARTDRPVEPGRSTVCPLDVASAADAPLVAG
ncbi:uncharacterized protein N7469_001935 [Penicillium citrinum]|uniref:Uncharacterized protein n=1 Tax=Penicillium citrinum TaxID=5077 RepID=A0A9W9P9J1_PENCI|nr:uncharacterized protein N7469_001935 [Penicillium citrinum]KAJ5240344.1 hypothetical protein N7469_001935 [Penicillium citrinum]